MAGAATTCDAGDFCAELAGAEATPFSQMYPDEPSRILLRSERVAAFIDLAPMIVGHLILAPTDHERSFGRVDDETWLQAMAIRDGLMRAMRDRVGATVILEHGSDDIHAVGRCIEHAHWHLLPVPQPSEFLKHLQAYGLRGGPVRDLRSALAAASANGQAYFYAGIPEAEGIVDYVFCDGLPHQHRFLRRALASFLGPNSPSDDWAMPDRQLFTQTRELFRDIELQMDGL